MHNDLYNPCTPCFILHINIMVRNRFIACLTFILSILSVKSASAQTPLVSEEEEQVINVIADFCKNDTMTYTDRMLKYKIEKGDTITEFDVETDCMIIVRDSTSNGYTMEMTNTDMRIRTVDDDITKAVIQASWEISKDMKCVFTTDELGNVQGITNWRELRSQYKDIVKSAIDRLFKENPGTDSIISRTRMEQQMLARVSNEESLRNELYDEIDLLFGCHGKAWNIGTREWDDTTNDYPTHYAIQVGYTEQEDEGDLEDDYAIISKTTQEIPLEDMLELGLNISGNMMTDGANEMVQNSKEEIMKSAAKDFTDVSVETYENYNYFFNGWPKQCAKVIVIDMGPQLQKVTAESIVWNSHSWYNF